MPVFRKYIIFLLFLFPHFLESQNTDSIEILNRECWEIVYSDPDSALILGLRAKKLAMIRGRTRDVNRANILLGIVYDIKARYDSAMFYHHQVLKSSQNIQDTMLIASSLSNIGLTFWHTGMYYNALENLFASLRVFESIQHNTPALASVYNNIGLIYSELGDYGKALDYFEKSRSVAIENNDMLNLGAVITNIAIVLSKKGLLSEALQTIDSSIQLKQRKNDFYGLSISYNEKATILLNNELFKDAYNMAGEALTHNKKINDLSNQAISYQILQRIFVHDGQFEKAIRYNKMAFDLAKKINDRKLILAHYKNMSEIYRSMGLFAEAYTNYVQYAEMKDSLLSEKQLSNIYQLEFQNQIDLQQNEIAMLQERQEIQNLQLEKQELLLSKRNLQLILIASVLSILLLLLYMHYMKTRHRHKRELVIAMMQQKSRQAQKIIQAELNERKRISREIHDSLGQLLSLIKMNLDSARLKISKKDLNILNKVDETIDLVDHTILEMRNISQNMLPVILREKGLETAIDDMVQRLKNVSKFGFNLEMLNIQLLDDQLIENTIYSVLQELLNNAVKHSACDRIDIQLVCSETEVNILVEDNGKGFDEPSVEYGLGIPQIKEKVENLGGSVEIDSMLGRGTIVTVEIPTKKIFEL
ncbi:MAG: sensor histidine kinase [Bacteroidetes bacterium]|jgi:signal transduction histidine kinase|nr:sensor histidine kinase [Bacteroidota bacterium]